MSTPIETAALKRTPWRALGITITFVVTFILMLTYGYGYSQLLKLNTALADNVASLQTDVMNAQSALIVLRKAVEDMQSQIVQTQTTPAVAKQEPINNELYLTLLKVDHQLDALPLLTTPTTSPSVSASSPSATQKEWWEKALERTWDVLQKILVVRYIGDDAMPVASPEQRVFLYQNLHAEMQTVIWAALHHDQRIYQASLLRAKTWIGKYFVLNAPITMEVLGQLDELGKANVQAE